ncbi:MAG TPA: hypothetical protein VFE50_13420 [Cyclobacteriaceae bacterium]|nr:hypothetical protein [Cyclobacteriaceae bacterium]
MLKGIIIVTLAFYIFYKITSFFFRAGAASQQIKNQANKQFRNDDKKRSNGGNVKGGEYVDYEEVK